MRNKWSWIEDIQKIYRRYTEDILEIKQKTNRQED